jgi:chromosomal replication initiator protein
VSENFTACPVAWEPIAAEVIKIAGADEFGRWMKNAIVRHCSDAGIEIAVPNLFMKNWFENNFRATIAAAAERVTGQSVAITFSVDRRMCAGSPSGIPAVGDVSTPAPASKIQNPFIKPVPAPDTLNPSFRFDSFVPGKVNRMCFSAAREVAANPGLSFNPLYLYGQPGVGKTHLIQAIASMSGENNDGVIYTTGEQFFAEYMHGINHDRLKSFREKYYRASMLIIDDIHKIASKPATQYEFHQLFDKLLDQGRQIVISGRILPREIDGLKEELMQRFLSGLVLRVDLPDEEARVAIVSNMLSMRGARNPGEEIIALLARSFTRNVRSLIGAVNRVIAYHNIVTRDHPFHKVSLQEVRMVLSELLDSEKTKVDMSDILEAVAAKFGTTPENMTECTKRQKVVLPRQVAMFLARKLTDYPLAEVGRFFGGKNHSTVTNAEKRITALIAEDPDAARMIAEIEDSILK